MFALEAFYLLTLSICVLLPPETSLLELPVKTQTQERVVYEVIRETIKTSQSSLPTDPEEERKYGRHI